MPASNLTERFVSAIARLLPTRIRSAITGDLLEEYRSFHLPTRGRLRSDIWLLGQSLWSVPATATLKNGSKAMIFDIGLLVFEFRKAITATRRSLRFSTGVTLLIGLGSSAAIAVFGVLNATLLVPLPYDEPDRVHYVMNRMDGVIRIWESYPNYHDLRENVTLIEELAATRGWQTTLVEDEAVQLAGETVTSNYFRVFGLRPTLGRLFDSSDEQGLNRVVLSHSFWSEVFSGDSAVVGASISLDGQPYLVVGVAPEDFVGALRDPDLWRLAPAEWAPGRQNRGARRLNVVARLASGTAPSQASAELNEIMRRLADEYPDQNAGRQLLLARVDERLTADMRRLAPVLAAAIVVLLLITCANVASLILTRAHHQARETAIRVAIGASRFRIIAGSMFQSLFLSTAGAALGLATASVLLKAVGTYASNMLPRNATLGVDFNVALFALATAIGTAVVFGTWSAIKSSRADAVTGLSNEGRSFSESRSASLSRRLLLGVEIALSLTLLTASSLLLRTMGALNGIDLGIDTENVVSFEVDPTIGYEAPASALSFHDQFLASIVSIPGVESAGAINILPLSGGFSCDGFGRMDRPRADPGIRQCAEYRRISGDYFETLEINLISGRRFDSRDSESAEPVIIINEAMSSQYYPDEEPLDKMIWIDGGPRRVVGVVENVRQRGITRTADPAIYAHLPQAQRRAMDYVVRASLPPGVVIAAIKEQLSSLDRSVPMADVSTMDRVVSGNNARSAFRAWLFSAFAGVALILTMIGLATVVSYNVNQGRRDIGIKMALGASSTRAVIDSARTSVTPLVGGVVTGVLLSLIAGRFVQSFLYGVSPIDAASLIAATASIAVVGAMASIVPATRAARIDPLESLRQ